MRILAFIAGVLLAAAPVCADETEDMLRVLSNAPAASGFESPVRKLLEKYWADQDIAYSKDGMGNLLGWLPCSGQDVPTVLVMAHMDEVGFLVTKIQEDGFIQAIPLGGWIDHVIWGSKWNIQVGDLSIPAISGMDAPHVLSDYTKSPEVSRSQFFLDTGMTKAELDQLGVRPGLPVTPDVEFYTVGDGHRYVGKAFDDRAGLAVMVDLMKELRTRTDLQARCQIVFAATTQEELGMRGSKTVYATLRPDLVLNIEAGIARDYPTQFTSQREPQLGKGPALFIYDGSMMPNANLVAEIEQVAKAHSIPIQWEAELGYGQDASCMQQSGRGMPAVNIGIPVRYAHSHYGMMDRVDYDRTIQLLLRVIEGLSAEKIGEMP